MTEPLVTVVISPREGHFMAESSLLSVLADNAIPYELIYTFGVDGLASSVRELAGEADPRPLLGTPVRPSSFRLDARNHRMLPV